ncbi:MAG: branched-chain amino acid ABC transporter permease [Fimbriimonadales bacterium]
MLGTAVPLFVSDPGLQDLAVLSAYYLLLAGGWNLLAGFSGQFSFAHAALAAVGAYGTVLLEVKWNVPVAATLPLAGLGTALIGAALGTILLRVRGVYLSLVSFAFAGAFSAWLYGAFDFTGGGRGHTTGILFSGVDQSPYVWLGLGLVIAYFVSQALLLNSRWGLYLLAVRDREEVAEGLGVRSRQVKVVAFAFSSFWAGVAGSLYAAYEGIVAPSIGNLLTMGLILAMVVVGGMGRRFGPLLGVLVLQVISYWVRGYGAQYTLLIFAALVLGVMLFSRDGLLALAEPVVRRYRPRERWLSQGPVR